MAKRRMMWMGPRNYERWVPASDARNDFSRIGNREQDLYLNGGSGIRGTKESHREYNFTWTGRNTDELRPVLDMAEGLFDLGEGDDLIYFIDPTSMERNVLSPMYASPYKTGLDGIPLLTGSDGYPIYPNVVPTATNFLGYPARSIVHNITPGTISKNIYVPIPEGTTLWVGAHGIDGGACVAVRPFRGPYSASVTRVPMLPVTTRERVNTSFRSAEGYTGVELFLAPTDPATTSGTVTLSGIMAQLLPDNAPPLPGEFISGRGNSGCEFAGTPTESPYLNGKVTAVTAKLVETGAWR